MTKTHYYELPITIHTVPPSLARRNSRIILRTDGPTYRTAIRLHTDPTDPCLYLQVVEDDQLSTYRLSLHHLALVALDAQG